MTEPQKPEPGTRYEIPEEGSLGLLALGYKGLVAWRAVRGRDWIEQRRQEHDTMMARVEAKKAEQEAQSEKKDVQTAEQSRPKLLPPEVLETLTITIVSGLPRSGTSMMMQMLTAGGMDAFTDDTREADESNPKGYYEHEKVKAVAKDSTWLKDADGLAVKVVAPLLRYLPPGPTYRVLLMQRSIDEILSSQSAMLDRDGRTSGDRGVLRRAYERQLSQAKAWINHQEKATGLEVSHLQAMSDPSGVAAVVNAFLGGNLHEDAMASIVDTSLHREKV
ncbi:MAG: hypothetical protein R3284_00170 [Rubricoccaceae bacterium]|nr:hypothetical protein [Rubricoccaceae bacterium]